MKSSLVVLASAVLLGVGQQGQATRDAADVLSLIQKIEAAVVRGDVAFVSSVLSDDFHFVHGDVAITYGRYVSLFVPKNRSANRGQLNSIWFERVYAKRDGRWMFLSHRTVHGPTASPAGVDPTATR